MSLQDPMGSLQRFLGPLASFIGERRRKRKGRESENTKERFEGKERGAPFR